MSEFLPITRVAERYATTKHSIYRWMREERGFPAPIRLPGETLRWRPSDLEAWESTRIVSLDSQLEAARQRVSQPCAVGDSPTPLRHAYWQCGLRTYYPFDKMEIGDTFDIPVTLAARCRTAASKHRKRTGKIFTLRKISDEIIRVTRVENSRPQNDPNILTVRVNPAHADWFATEFTKVGLTFARFDLKSVVKFNFATPKPQDRLSVNDLFITLDRKRRNKRTYPEPVACSTGYNLPKVFPLPEPNITCDYQ